MPVAQTVPPGHPRPINTFLSIVKFISKSFLPCQLRATIKGSAVDLQITPFPFFKCWVTLPWRSLILESHIFDIALSNLIIVRSTEEWSVCHYLRCKGFVTLHFIKISANNCIIIVVRLFFEVLLHTFWSLPWLPSFSTQLLFLYEYFSIVAISVS